MIIPRARLARRWEKERKEVAGEDRKGDLLRSQLHAESLMERFEPGISRMPWKAIAT